MDSGLTPVVANFGAAPTDSGHDRFSMEMLDRYKLVARLAQGGMAEVYFAAYEVEPFVHRPVVVKRLHPHLARDSKLVQMFVDEARLLCELDHPHIVRTLEAGIIDGQCCIAMEYLEGQPLQIVLRRVYERGQLPVELAVHIVAAMLDGLHYAHEVSDQSGRCLDIVHRDVSPHNVFVTNAGEVKLLDFGIAKARTQEGRTATGMVKGKVGYIAPEQATAAVVDRRADVWSAGVVLFEALTGERLFKADSDAATILLALTARIPSASALRADVPATLEAILARALTRDPSHRYQTAFEMQLELKDWLCANGSPDGKGGLARLMRTSFGLEIAEQRRLTSMLIARSDCTPPSIRAVTASVSGAESSSWRSSSPGDEGTDDRSSRSTVRPSKPTGREGLIHSRPLAVAALFAAISATVTLVVIVALHEGSSSARAGVGAATGAAAERIAAAAARPGEMPEATPRMASRPVAPTPVAAAAGETPIRTTSARSPLGSASTTPRETRRPSAPMATPATSVVPVAAAPGSATSERAENARDEFGFLTIDTTPWSLVSDHGKVLGQTPLVGASLPSGTHVLSLRNSELGVETTYTVEIVAGKTAVRRIGIE
ncbi:MAG TPA: serine/threonine-protein kinase [Polyangiaceae bacterium]